MAECYTEYNWKPFPAIQGNAEIHVGNFIPIEDCGGYAYLDWEGWYNNALALPEDLTGPVVLPFSWLSHDTSHKVTRILLSGGGFRGFGPYNVSWWSINNNKGVANTDMLRRKYKRRLSSLHNYYDNFDVDSYIRRTIPGLNYLCGDTDVVEYFLEQFGSSPAFDQTHSMFGNYRFTFQLKDMIAKYKTVMCDEEKNVAFKILGTVRYAKEVMYSIIVCPEGCEAFHHLPLLQGNQDLIYFSGGLPCKWKPQSSGCFTRRVTDSWQSLADPYDRSRRWDIVSFGFYLPKGKSLRMDIDPEVNLDVVDNREDPKLSIKGDGYSRHKARAKLQELLRDIE